MHGQRSATCLTLGLISALGGITASAAPRPQVTVVVGESIGGVRIGMTRAQVTRLGFELTPDDLARGDEAGFLAGPLHIFFETTHDTVRSVSVELKKTSGLRIGRSSLSPSASMQQLARLLPDCPVEDEGLGLMLTCPLKAGLRLTAHTEGSGPVVQVMLSR